MEGSMKIKVYHRLNYALFAVGMIGVWTLTENWWVMFWAFIASLHFSSAVKREIVNK
jgi:hypothetical protein